MPATSARPVSAFVAAPCIKKVENDIAKGKACAQRELARVDGARRRRGKARAHRRLQGHHYGARRSPTRAGHNTATSSARSSTRSSRAFCPASATHCRMQTTAQRVLLLRKLGDAVNEH